MLHAPRQTGKTSALLALRDRLNAGGDYGCVYANVHKAPERTIADGLAQTCAYMDRAGAEAGHLVVFDCAPDRTWEDKVFRREAAPGPGGAPVTVWGM